MSNVRQSTRLLILVLLSLATVISLSLPGWASIGSIVKSDLAGTWQIALRGTTTDCGGGFTSVQGYITLNTAGSGTGTLQGHSPCGISAVPATFTVTSLKPNGSGTAGLSCSGCGGTFDIQVAPDRSKFNLVDVSAANPGIFLEGVAILTSPAGNIATSDFTGGWQVTLYGQGLCGFTDTNTGSGLLTFTLDSSGNANATETSHTAGCGDSQTTGNLFTIQSNSDGSGTATLNCQAVGGCGFSFNIQVSPDRSTLYLVDTTAVAGPVMAGVAINNSTASNIVTANLAGAWQVTLYGQGGCGPGTSLVTFTLNASGNATNATETNHNGCANNRTTGNTFTIQSLNPNGSGTAGLSCGAGCGFTFKIQVSPDRSTFSLVDVSDPNNFQIGTAIHQ